MRAPRKALFITLILLAVILQPFSAIVPQVQASPSGMEQVIFGGTWDSLLDPVVTEYNTLIGGQTWTTDDALRYKLVSTDGVIKNLRVKLSGAPGVGNKYNFRLMLNMVPTALTFDIVDPATSGSDMIHEVVVTGGDYFTLRCDPENTPTAVYATWTCVFSGDTPNESLILGGSDTELDNTVIEWGQVMAADTSFSIIEDSFLQVVPTAGTIKNFYVRLRFDPGTPPEAYRFTVRLNKATVAQSLIVTITANAIAGSDLVHNLAVVAGDILTLMVEPLNTPSVTPIAAWGMTFVADIDGESIVIGGSYENLDNVATEYNRLSCTSGRPWSDIETDRYSLGQVCTLKKLHILLENAPGAGNSYEFRIRVDGADSDLGVLISGLDTTGHSSVSAEADIANDNYVNLQVVPTSTPAVGNAYWGFVCYTGPPLPDPKYTPKIATFAIAADAGWRNYDLHTFWDVPKGAVAEIVVANKNIDFARIAGVRTGGSSINRYIDLHEAEGLGVTTANMFVKCHETTGLIEVYSEIGVDVDFYLLGYFNSSFDFTESFTSLGQPGLAWTDKGLPAVAATWWSYYNTGNDPNSAWTDAPKAWDGDYGTYSTQNSGLDEDSRLEATTVANTPPSGTITKVSIQAWLRTGDFSMRPVFDGALGDEHQGMAGGGPPVLNKFDVTSDTNAPSPWTWADVQNLDIRLWRRLYATPLQNYEFRVEVEYEYEVPANAVVQILMGNEAVAADYFAGVRAKGSTLERGYTLDEAEGGSIKSPAGSWSTLSMVVQSDASAVIEWKGGSVTDVTMWLLGWFNADVSFTEGFTDYSPAADSTWTSKTVAEAVADSIVAFALMHQDAGSETFCGLKEEGSVLTRMVEEHEAEGGASTGFQACITIDADKNCEVYCEDASEAQFSYTGYFIITLPPVKPNIPSLVAIVFNTTIAGTGCSIYAEFFDTEGLYGYIFWNNGTSPPGGVNSSFTSMTGTSNSTQEDVTLPVSGTLFGCKYYVNDTDDNWGRDSLVMFPTAAIGDGAVNIPAINEIVFNTTIAGTVCEIYGGFSDVEGLSGYIFWNNATSPPGGVNSSFTSLTGTSDSAIENITLPSFGTKTGVIYYVNDTEGNWGVDTLVIFPTADMKASINLLAVFIAFMGIVVIFAARRR